MLFGILLYLYEYKLLIKTEEVVLLKEYIEERAVEIANYIIKYNATVRQTAKQFGISKSTVHTDDTKWNVKEP